MKLLEGSYWSTTSAFFDNGGYSTSSNDDCEAGCNADPDCWGVAIKPGYCVQYNKDPRCFMNPSGSNIADLASYRKCDWDYGKYFAVSFHHCTI